MVPRIKESRGDPGPPPCGVLLEGEAHGGPIFPRIQQMKDGLKSEESVCWVTAPLPPMTKNDQFLSSFEKTEGW